MEVKDWKFVTLASALSVVGLASLYSYLKAAPKRAKLKEWKTRSKTIIITGASDGIGRQLALYFAEHRVSPVNLVLAARNKVELLKVARLCEDGGRGHGRVRAIAVQTDVSDTEQCARLIKECVQTFGGIDVLVNNAAIQTRSLFENMDARMFDRVMNVNFNGAVYTTRAALPHLKHTQGLLVNVSSVLGYAGFPYSSHYCASKHAMHGWSDSIRMELLAHGVDVLLVCPSGTSTHMSTKGFDAVSDPDADQKVTIPKSSGMMTPEVAAEMIAHSILRRDREVILAHGVIRYFRLFAPLWLDQMAMQFMGVDETR